MRLAFFGPQRSGKTATAEAFAEDTSEMCVISPFSGCVLHEVLRGVNSANYRQPDAQAMEALHEEYLANKEQWRPLVVAWGMWRRDQDPDYWVKDWLQRMGETEQYWEGKASLHWFVDDVRFANEYEMLKNAGFKFIRTEGNPDERENNLREALEQAPERYYGEFDFDLFLPWMPVEKRVARIKEYLNA